MSTDDISPELKLGQPPCIGNALACEFVGRRSDQACSKGVAVNSRHSCHAFCPGASLSPTGPVWRFDESSRGLKSRNLAAAL